MRRLLVAVAALALAVPAASAKDGAQAHLLAPTVPADAAPGSVIRVRWTVDVPDEHGRRAPFGAIGMFVRLVGRGGASTTATARQVNGPPYSVRLRVPRGGIRAVRFGLHGSTDVYFPLAKD